MLILKSLQFENIGRFIESQTIDFTRLGSLVQLEGKNLNTGGSSGAAKSTVFKALEFLFGINSVANTVLQCRYTDKSIAVVGEFDYNGLPLTIQRGKKLLIDLNGEVTTGSSKVTEEKLDQIIGMPRDLFLKTIHKRQDEGGFFLDMGGTKIHKFLTDCLGLQKEQSKILILDTKLKTLTEEETKLKTAHEANWMGIRATETALLGLGSPPTLEIDPSALETLKTRCSELAYSVHSARKDFEIELQELEKTKPIISIAPFDRSNIEFIEKEISAILAQISDLEKKELSRQSKTKLNISELNFQIDSLRNIELKRQYEVKAKISSNLAECGRLTGIIKEGDNAKEKAIKLAEELKKIRASICPTCDQNWITENIKTKESDIIKQLQKCKTSIVDASTASNSLVGIGTEYENLKIESQPIDIKEIEEIRKNIAQLIEDSNPQSIPEAIELKMKADFKHQELSLARQAEQEHQFKESAKSQLLVVNFAQKQTELRKKHEEIVKNQESLERSAIQEYDTAKNKVYFYEQSKKRFEESSNKLKEDLLKYTDLAMKNSLQIDKLNEEIQINEWSQKAIKSYLSCSFEDALDSIGDKATKLLRSVPNMASATVQFEGLKETQEGKVKEEVNAVISMDGEIGIPIKSLSGGERSAVDLGIDLAVIKFIEENTGNGMDLFVLDEPFKGLDTPCILDAVEMLKSYADGKRVILVDHNPILAQTIENRITVIRDGLYSKIVQG